MDYLKERLKISKLAKYESDMSISERRYSSTKSRNFTEVCTIQTVVKSRDFAEHILVIFEHITLKLGDFIDFKAFFPATSKDFR